MYDPDDDDLDALIEACNDLDGPLEAAAEQLAGVAKLIAASSMNLTPGNAAVRLQSLEQLAGCVESATATIRELLDRLRDALRDSKA